MSAARQETHATRRKKPSIIQASELVPRYGGVEQAQRVARKVRGHDGAIHTRLVIQHGSKEMDSFRAYSLEKVLFEQKKKGVTIFLATPARQDPHAPDSVCLLTCDTPPVVIKAVPQVAKKNNSNAAHVDNPLSEIAALQQLPGQHPNVIHLIDCMQDEDFVYMVLPYLDQDLYSRVDAMNGAGLPEDEACKYFHDMVQGLLFMKQTSGLAHHDISLENVMVTGSGEESSATIIDMGMCLQVPHASGSNGEPVFLTGRPCHGKPGYLSPESVREDACDPFASDVWSLGVCLYTMLTGRPLYSSPSDEAFRALAQGGIRRVLAVYERYGLKLSPSAKDLVCAMLESDPSRRITLEELLEYPYVTAARCDVSERVEYRNNNKEHCSHSYSETETKVVV